MKWSFIYYMMREECNKLMILLQMWKINCLNSENSQPVHIWAVYQSPITLSLWTNIHSLIIRHFNISWWSQLQNAHWTNFRFIVFLKFLNDKMSKFSLKIWKFVWSANSHLGLKCVDNWSVSDTKLCWSARNWTKTEGPIWSVGN